MPETRWGERPFIVEQHAETTDVEEKRDGSNLEHANHLETEQPSNNAEIFIDQTGKPAKSQFVLWGPLDKTSAKGIGAALIMPFRLFAYPIVVWASFVFAWAASMLVIINVTQSQAFAGPPWNMTATEVGYTNFGAIVGVALSLVIAGPLSDWVSAFQTRRNKGIREPEMRLVTLFPFAIACLIGGVVVAVGYQQQWSWPAIVVPGYGLLGLVLPALSAISLTYAVSKLLTVI